MDLSIWLVVIIWLPTIWFKLGSVLEVLKEIRDILKKGGEAE